MADTSNLTNFLGDIADAIRTKKETTEQIPAANFDTEILDITTGVMTEEEYNRCEGIADSILGEAKPYTKLEYIRSTGTQYIDTLLVPNKNTKILLGVSDVSGTVSSEGGLLGAYTDWALNSFLLYIANGIRWTYNGELILTSDATSYHDIELYRKSCKIDGNIISSDTTDISSQINTNLTIFKGGSRLSNMKLYYFKIYNGEELIMDFIPVKRNEDNIICLYDKVTKQYFTNQGTGNFIAGGVI